MSSAAITFDKVQAALARVGCPLAVKSSAMLSGGCELRLQVLEWLLEQYDSAFFKKCRSEAPRAISCGKQLWVLGLGGTRPETCEAFAREGEEKETLAVVWELCHLVAESRLPSDGEQQQQQMLRDLSCPARLAARADLYFAKELSLFPPQLLAALDPEPEILDLPTLLEQLQQLLTRLRERAAALEAAAEQTRDPREGPRLGGALRGFGKAVEEFNHLYSREMSQWQVRTAQPDRELAAVCRAVRAQQKTLADYLDAFARARSGLQEATGLETKVPRLHIDRLLSDEHVAQLATNTI